MRMPAQDVTVHTLDPCKNNKKRNQRGATSYLRRGF